MSDTPRTDRCMKNCNGWHHVPIETARELERELNLHNKELEILRWVRKFIADHLNNGASIRKTSGSGPALEINGDCFVGNITIEGDPDRELTFANERIVHIQKGCASQNEEVCQIAGKALGYPWFKDDPKNFPDADESCGVCVGAHVAETIVEELAMKYLEVKTRIDALESASRALIRKLDKGLSYTDEIHRLSQLLK